MAESSEPPPQTPPIKAEQQSDGAAKGQDKANAETKATNPIAPVEDQHTAEDAKRKADNEADKRAEEASEYGVFFGRRLKITDALLALFTLFLVLVGIGQGIFLYRTDQGTHKAADAAKESADAARHAVELAEKTAERQLRAYVLPESAILTQISDANPRYTLRTKNYGQTPAKNMTVWVAWRYFDSPAIDIPTKRPEIKYSQFLLGPQGFTVDTDLIFLDEDRKNKIRGGAARLYLFGDIRYEDIFGLAHTTKYRFVWGGEFSVDTLGPLDVDHEGNEAD